MAWDEIADFLRNAAVLIGLRVVGVILGAVLLTALLRRAVRKVETRIALQGAGARHAQRTRTLTKVLTSAGIVAIWVIALLTALGAMNFELAPVLAGLGIGGLAIGFGAQSLVRDVVSGFFILLEDQYGIGDIIEVNKLASGTVEQLTLRLTGVRDIDGTIHYFSNGAITQVSNRSKDWSGVLIDVRVGSDQDLGRVRDLLQRVAEQLGGDEELSADLLDQPVVLGVEAIEDKDVALRLSAQVKPGRQHDAMREMRARIKSAFDAEGIAFTTT
ncbi:MAG: mechanosensitive ion channel family protein [Actinomycetota bacterium]|nr:mechanosensitive ion channel family protein [Actinomycetota bacterium]